MNTRFERQRFDFQAETVGEMSKALESVVTLIFASWNQIGAWLRQLNSLRPAA